MALKVLRSLRVHGQQVVLNTRIVGARNAYTGAAVITYGSDQTIRALVGRPQTNPVPTDLGTVTMVSRSLVTATAILKQDKITLDDGTYYVRDTPTQTHRGRVNDKVLFYRTTIVRDPLA